MYMNVWRHTRHAGHGSLALTQRHLTCVSIPVWMLWLFLQNAWLLFYYHTQGMSKFWIYFFAPFACFFFFWKIYYDICDIILSCLYGKYAYVLMWILKRKILCSLCSLSANAHVAKCNHLIICCSISVLNYITPCKTNLAVMFNWWRHVTGRQIGDGRGLAGDHDGVLQEGRRVVWPARGGHRRRLGVRHRLRLPLLHIFLCALLIFGKFTPRRATRKTRQLCKPEVSAFVLSYENTHSCKSPNGLARSNVWLVVLIEWTSSVLMWVLL